MTYDTVIFDMDGVLVADSPRWVFDRAATRALVTSGVDEPTERDRGFLSGFPADLNTAEAHFADRYRLDLEELWRRRERFASVNQLRVLRTGEKDPFDDIGVLTELDADIAVVSNNQHATVESVVRQHDIERHVDAWFGLDPTLEGIRRRKPDPWYLEEAHDTIDGGTTLYVGDRESDVSAATRAGMDSALITRSGDPVDVDLEPTHHIASLIEIPALIDGRGTRVEYDRDESHPVGGDD